MVVSINMPEELKKFVEEVAQRYERSFSGQVVFLLKQYRKEILEAIRDKSNKK